MESPVFFLALFVGILDIYFVSEWGIEVGGYNIPLSYVPVMLDS